MLHTGWGLSSLQSRCTTLKSIFKEKKERERGRKRTGKEGEKWDGREGRREGEGWDGKEGEKKGRGKRKRRKGGSGENRGREGGREGKRMGVEKRRKGGNRDLF